LATGGSTNHSIHLIAMARAAGVQIDWQDMAELSSAVPLLCRIYPNGHADVNQFHAAGGMALLIRELLALGLLHADVPTVFDDNGLVSYQREAFLDDASVIWREGNDSSLDRNIIADGTQPFSASGGLNVLSGNLGRAVIKVSAVQAEHRKVTAPAVVLHSQHDLKALFDRGELERDFVAVVRFQGPRANGMPELHKLTPVLGILQDRGYRVALVTDGRMSGASGKTPAAIHLYPEALDGGAIARVQDGDLIALDADAGTLELLVDGATLNARPLAPGPVAEHEEGMGRELFAPFRHLVGTAEAGACVFNPD
jgi:phosphogluconate dehydratase